MLVCRWKYMQKECKQIFVYISITIEFSHAIQIEWKSIYFNHFMLLKLEFKSTVNHE